MDLQKKISLFKQYLRTHLESEGDFAWIESLNLVEVSPRKFVICGFSNPIFRDYITVHYDDKVREALEVIFPEKAPFKSKKIEYCLGEYQHPKKVAVHQESLPFLEPTASEEKAKQVASLSPELTDRVKEFTSKPEPEAYAPFHVEHTFENFAVGESNQLAYKAAKSLVYHQHHYNPLIIHGVHGVGKTHLLESIGLGLMQEQPSLRIEYTHAENFLNTFLMSLQKKQMEEFRKKYRQCDVLILDGLQILQGKNACQEELLHTISELLQKRKQVIASCVKKPSDFTDCRYELVSKLESGLVAQIDTPDFKTRLECVKQIAKRLGFSLPVHICQLVAKSAVGDMRKIRQALIRLNAHSSLLNRQITTEMVRNELQVFDTPAEQPSDLHIKTILQKICENASLLEADVCSKKRGDRLTEARNIYAYLARQMTDLTLNEISMPLGRSHSAMHTSIKKLEEELATNDILRRKVEHLRASIQGSVNEVRKKKRS